MKELVFSMEAVLPVFLTMVLGWFLKNKNVLKQEFFDGVSKFVFYVATPSLLFVDTSSVDFYSVFDVKFVLITLGTLVASAVCFWFIFPLIEKDRRRIGAMIHCSFRSNFAILGLPLLKGMLSAAGTAKAEVLLAFGVPVFNVGATWCLAYWSGEKKSIGGVLKNILKNPLIIGCVSGLICSLVKIKIPTVLIRTVDYVGDTSIGLGLILMGAAFDIKAFIRGIRKTLVSVVAKIVVSPLVGVIVLWLAGYRGEELLIALVFMGSSTAINSYVMAREMKSDAEYTSSVVVATTGLSVFTLFVGIFIIKSIMI